MLRIQLTGQMENNDILRKRIEKTLQKVIERLPDNAELRFKLSKISGEKEFYKGSLFANAYGKTFFFDERSPSVEFVINKTTERMTRSISAARSMQRQSRKQSDVILRREPQMEAHQKAQ